MKWGIWLMVLVLAGALVLVGVQQAQIGKLRARIVDLEAQPAPLAGSAASSSPRVLPGKSENPRVARVGTRNGTQLVDHGGAVDPDGDAELGKSIRKMVDNPAGRALMNQGIKAMTSMWFADLVDEFDLTKEESEYFLQLAAGPMAAQQEIGMKLMGAETDEERKALAEEIETVNKESKDAIKEFLNDDEDFATYEEFEKRLPERQQLDGLRAVMASAEAPLTPEQEDQVIDAMYRARTSENATTDWSGTGGLDAIASGEASEKFEQEWEKSAQRTAAEVGKVLEGPQLEAFRSYQEQMKDMQLMGIKMAEKMFKKDEGSADPK